MMGCGKTNSIVMSFTKRSAGLQLASRRVAQRAPLALTSKGTAAAHGRTLIATPFRSALPSIPPCQSIDPLFLRGALPGVPFFPRKQTASNSNGLPSPIRTPCHVLGNEFNNSHPHFPSDFRVSSLSIPSFLQSGGLGLGAWTLGAERAPRQAQASTTTIAMATNQLSQLERQLE